MTQKRNDDVALIPPDIALCGTTSLLEGDREDKSITTLTPAKITNNGSAAPAASPAPGYMIRTPTALIWLPIQTKAKATGADNSHPTASMSGDQTNMGQEVAEATVKPGEKVDTPTDRIDGETAGEMEPVDSAGLDWSKLSWIQRTDLTTLYHLRVRADTPSGFATTGPYWPFQSVTAACKKVLEELRGSDFAQHFADNYDMLDAKALRSALGYGEDEPLPFEIVFNSLSGKEVIDVIRHLKPEHTLTLFLVRKSAEPPPVYQDVKSGTVLQGNECNGDKGPQPHPLVSDVSTQRATVFGEVKDWDIDSVHLTASSANTRASALLSNWHNYFGTREKVSSLEKQNEAYVGSETFSGYLRGRKHGGMWMERLMGAVEVVKQDGFWRLDEDAKLRFG